MIEYLTVGIVVIACALYWGARLFPGATASIRTRLGLRRVQVTTGTSDCGGCRACSSGKGCH